jgi:hypothetical protein
VRLTCLQTSNSADRVQLTDTLQLTPTTPTTDFQEIPERHFGEIFDICMERLFDRTKNENYDFRFDPGTWRVRTNSDVCFG